MYTATTYQPIFKFLSKEWSKALLEKGNVRLGTLYEFRNTKDYKGKILDEDEGKIWMMSRDMKIELQVHTLPNLYIYSSSQYLFSNTYNQSMEDEKDSCVMITNPQNFFKEISKPLGFIEPTQLPCNYEGRKFPEDHQIFRSNIKSLAFQKPVEYKDHREYRAVWHNHLNDNQRGHSQDILEVIPYCINVNIEDVDPNVIKGDGIKKQIEVKVLFKDESNAMILRYSRPFNLFTPVLFQQNNEGDVFIGFTQESKDGNYRLEFASLVGGLGGSATVTTRKGQTMIISNFDYLNKVKEIVISTISVLNDNLGYRPFP